MEFLRSLHQNQGKATETPQKSKHLAFGQLHVGTKGKNSSPDYDLFFFFQIYIFSYEAYKDNREQRD